jgi:alkaline phosphatase D
VIQGITSTIALIGLPSASWGNQRWSRHPFSMGIASGSPTHEGVVLWTRLDPGVIEAAGLTTQSVPVTWQLAHDAQFSRIVAQGVTQASPALAHSVHAEINGLSPDHHYFYRFLAGSASSTTGRTRTFPAPDAKPASLRLAYASCQQWGNGYYSAYRHMLDENLDLVMFLGDYMYEYPSSRPKDIRPTTGGWVDTLEGYRQRHALHKSDLDLQAMHAAAPWLITWDDHEVQNDYAGIQQGNSGRPVEDFLSRRRAAYQAFYEHMPVRRADFEALISTQNNNVKVFGSKTFGQLATLYLLDTRQYRDPQVCNPNNKVGGSRVDPSTCAIWNDPKRTLLGPQQENWLRREFKTSSTQWNVIGQQSLLGQRNFDTQGGIQFSNDGWDGYAQARQRLIDSMIQTKLRNPVVLGGDIHQNWVGHILSDYNVPTSSSVGVEFCGTSITSLSNMNQEKVDQLLRVNPHFIFANAEYRGYGVVEFTPKDLYTTLRVVADATDPRSPIQTLAAFRVESDQSTIKQIK